MNEIGSGAFFITIFFNSVLFIRYIYIIHIIACEKIINTIKLSFHLFNKIV